MIYENEKELKILQDFCDIALKVGGIKNVQIVNEVLNNLKPFKTESLPEAEVSGSVL